MSETGTRAANTLDTKASDVAEVRSDQGHEAIYDDVMADTITRLVAIYDDMPTLMQPACPYSTTIEVEDACRAVCLALLILDDCCTRVWATRRRATDGRTFAHGVGYTAETPLAEGSGITNYAIRGKPGRDHRPTMRTEELFKIPKEPLWSVT
jgi:hypothetical protein